MKKNENGSLQHSSRMCKRFKISDFEQSCNNEMLTQEDDAEDKDDNYNAYEGNEEELKNENGFCHSSRIQKMLQMSDIEDSCDDELVVIQDAPEDRTDSDKRSEELSYNARKLLEHRKLLSENSTERSKLNSNEKPFSWNDLFKKVNACKLYEALKKTVQEESSLPPIELARIHTKNHLGLAGFGCGQISTKRCTFGFGAYCDIWRWRCYLRSVSYVLF